MKLGSLFTGYGGLDLALERVLGTETAWVSDIDVGANKIIAERFKDVPNLGNIAEVDWSTVEPVDVLTGGFPCQDVSHAGRGAGMKPGTRSGLWAHMAFAINELRPSLVVIENVRGLLSARTETSKQVDSRGPKGGRKVGHTDRALGRVLSDLAELGYDAQWYSLRAADIGAPHLRLRVFVAAYPRGEAGLEWAGLRAANEAGLGRGLPARGGGPDDGLTTSLLPTPAVNDMGSNKTVEWWDEWAPRQKSAEGKAAPHGPSLAIEAKRMLPEPHLLPTPNAAIGAGGQTSRSGDRKGEPLLGGIAKQMLPTPTARDHKDGTYVEAVPENHLLGRVAWRLTETFREYAPAVERWEAILGREAPPPTEATGRGGAARLAPRFVEWMMGLPEGHVTDVPGLSRNAQLKALGNGVVPQQAEQALRVIFATQLDLARMVVTPACTECGNDDPAEGHDLCTDCLEGEDVDHITEADLAKVAKRHPSIEQDGLDSLEGDPAAFAPAIQVVATSSVARGEQVKVKPVKPAFYAICPFHAPGLKVRNTAVIRDGDRFVFREHEKSIGAHRWRCAGSGTEWSEELCGPREART